MKLLELPPPTSFGDPPVGLPAAAAREAFEALMLLLPRVHRAAMSDKVLLVQAFLGSAAPLTADQRALWGQHRSGALERERWARLHDADAGELAYAVRWRGSEGLEARTLASAAQLAGLSPASLKAYVSKRLIYDRLLPNPDLGLNEDLASFWKINPDGTPWHQGAWPGGSPPPPVAVPDPAV